MGGFANWVRSALTKCTTWDVGLASAMMTTEAGNKVVTKAERWQTSQLAHPSGAATPFWVSTSWQGIADSFSKPKAPAIATDAPVFGGELSATLTPEMVGIIICTAIASPTMPRNGNKKVNRIRNKRRMKLW